MAEWVGREPSPARCAMFERNRRLPIRQVPRPSETRLLAVRLCPCGEQLGRATNDVAASRLLNATQILADQFEITAKLARMFLADTAHFVDNGIGHA